MFILSQSQLATLTAIFENDTTYVDANGVTVVPIASTHPRAAFYRALADMADGQDGVDPYSIVWLRGAADVNESVGPESEFIRGYNMTCPPKLPSV